MKRKEMASAGLLLCFFLLSCATATKISTKVIPDTARIVRLSVPACTSENAEARIRNLLMRIEGVYDVRGDTPSRKVTITFDPENANVAALIKALSHEEFTVRGKPVFIK